MLIYANVCLYMCLVKKRLMSSSVHHNYRLMTFSQYQRSLLTTSTSNTHTDTDTHTTTTTTTDRPSSGASRPSADTNTPVETTDITADSPGTSDSSVGSDVDVAEMIKSYVKRRRQQRSSSHVDSPPLSTAEHDPTSATITGERPSSERPGGTDDSVESSPAVSTMEHHLTTSPDSEPPATKKPRLHTDLSGSVRTSIYRSVYRSISRSVSGLTTSPDSEPPATKKPRLHTGLSGSVNLHDITD